MFSFDLKFAMHALKLGLVRDTNAGDLKGTRNKIIEGAKIISLHKVFNIEFTKRKNICLTVLTSSGNLL